MTRLPPSKPPNRPGDRESSTISWTVPEPGDVISYAYLWAHEAAQGQEEGLKDRPSVVVIAQAVQGNHIQLLVTPVTHRKPPPGAGIEIPPAVKRHLGLDGEQSWIVVTELNRFIWPGPDIRPVPARKSPLYGAIPAKLFHQVRDAIVHHHEAARLAMVKRSE